MFCPICKTQLKSGVTKCPTCKFDDIRYEFINQDELDFWMDTIVEPYRIEYERPKTEIVVELGDIVTTDNGVFIVNPMVEGKHILFINKTIGDSVKLSTGKYIIKNIKKSGKKPFKSNEELLKHKKTYLEYAHEADYSRPVRKTIVENGDIVTTTDGRTFNVDINSFPIQKETLIGKKVGDTFEVVGKNLIINGIKKGKVSEIDECGESYTVITSSNTLVGFFRSNGFNVIDSRHRNGKLWVEQGPHLDECVQKAREIFNVDGWFTKGSHTGYRRFWVTKSKK